MPIRKLLIFFNGQIVANQVPYQFCENLCFGMPTSHTYATRRRVAEPRYPARNFLGKNIASNTPASNNHSDNCADNCPLIGGRADP